MKKKQNIEIDNYFMEDESLRTGNPVRVDIDHESGTVVYTVTEKNHTYKRLNIKKSKYTRSIEYKCKYDKEGRIVCKVKEVVDTKK